MYKVLVKDINVIDGFEFKPLDITPSSDGLIVQASDPLNFKFSIAVKTYPIEILNTPANNLLLRNLFNNNFDITVQFDAYLEIDNIYMKAILYIDSVSKKFAKGQVVSTSGLIWGEKANQLLSDQTWTDWDHILNEEAIGSNNTNIVYDYIPRGYTGYPFVEGEEWYEENIDYTAIEYSSLKTGIEYLRPAPKLSTVLNKIFEGSTIEQNIWTPFVYEKIYLTPIHQNLLVSADFKKNHTVDRLIEVDDATEERYSEFLTGNGAGVNHVFLNHSFGDVENKITSSEGREFVIDPLYKDGQIFLDIIEDGTYSIRGKFKSQAHVAIYADANEHPYVSWRNRNFLTQISILKPDLTEIIKYTHTQTYANTGNVLAYNIDLESEFNAPGMWCEAGDKIKLTFKYTNTQHNSEGTVTILNQVTTVKRLATSFLKIIPTEYLSYGALVTTKHILPRWTIEKFMTALLTNFNIELHYNFDENKIILNNRYYNAPDVYPLPNNIILDNYTITFPELQNYQLRYAIDTKDKYAEERFTTYPAMLSVDIDNKSLKTKVIEIPFSLNATGRRSSQKIMMYKEDKQYSTDFNLRLMLLSGFSHQTQTVPKHQVHIGTVPPTIIQPTWVAEWVTGMKTIYTGAILPAPTTPFTLNINDIVEVYTDRTDTWAGIYNRYFKGNIERLTEPTFEVVMFIDDIMLSNILRMERLDLRALWYINHNNIQGYFQIIKMDRIEDKIFKCLLFRDKPPVLTNAPQYNPIPDPDPDPDPTTDFGQDFNDDF